MENITELDSEDAGFSMRETLSFCLSEFMHNANCETRAISKEDSHAAKMRALTAKKVKRETVSVNLISNRDEHTVVATATMDKDCKTIDKSGRWCDYYNMLRRIGRRLA